MVMNLVVMGGTLACVVPGLIVLALSVYEAHTCASRLATGQTLAKNGYTTWFCYRFACFLDSRAVYEGDPTPLT